MHSGNIQIFFVDSVANFVRIFHRGRYHIRREAQDVFQTRMFSIIFFPSEYSPLFDPQIITERLTINSHTEPVKKHTPPSYALSATYVQSASGGKSLLARGKASDSKTYNAFFDEAGVMNQGAFEQWVGGLVERVMEDRDT